MWLYQSQKIQIQNTYIHNINSHVLLFDLPESDLKSYLNIYKVETVTDTDTMSTNQWSAYKTHSL